MARRRSKKQDPLAQIISIILGMLTKKQKAMFLLIVNAILIAIALVWYAFQPEVRKREVTKIVQNYCDGKRKISVTELVYDIFTLYYNNNAVACDYDQGTAPVYGGLPRRKDNSTLTVLPNIGYWVGYDETLRTPAWSAYKLLHMDNPPPNKERPSQFDTDQRTIAKITSDDYTGSGFDRGHLAPNFAIARCYGEDAQKETFLMSNIVPQRHAINAGNWKTLETLEAVNYPDRFEHVWVIAGPIYASANPRKLPGGVPIPDAFFKIHVDEREGAIRTQAFLFKHAGNGKEQLNTLLVSVDELEKLTGLDFFPELPADVQQKLQATKATSTW